MTLMKIRRNLIMKIVLQRVNRARVSVEGQVVGAIGKGYLLLIGISSADTKEQVEKMAEKIEKLRIFPDENGKTNLSIGDVGGEVLVISQFTLYADCKKGNRPSFINAGNPRLAEELYKYFIEISKTRYVKVEEGVFGASMKVELENDGPFTLVLESEYL
jgi:D-tyrosyl-tRNA(Tyr) deacylase